MTSELADTKGKVAIATRVLADVGLATGVTASLGHVSMRLPSDPNRFLVKGREYDVDALAVMGPEHMVLCDLDGNLVDGPAGVTQPSEVKIHACVLKARPDVQSVVHVHPRYTVLMSVLQIPLAPMCQEGHQLVRRPLPVYPHLKTIQSDEEGTEVAALLGGDKAMLLRGHGAVTTGVSVAESVLSMIQLEEQARMNYLAFSAMGPDYPRLSDELIEEITDRAPLYELPHFKDVLKGRGPQRDGIWNYRVSLVS